MTAAQVVGLGVRLFAIWLFVYLVSTIPSSVLFLDSPSAPTGVVVTALASFLLLVVLTITMWTSPLSVAKRLIPDPASQSQSHLSAEEIQRIGFCLLGLWMLADAIPSASSWAMFTYYASKPNPTVTFTPQIYASLVHVAVEFVLGVWLVFGAKGLLGFVRWARSVAQQ